MRAILVRHCETDRNRDGLVQGRSDSPLNQTGLLQAERLAARLAASPLDAVYSSPLRRALETARPIAADHQLDLAIAPELVELDVGAMDGLSGAEMRQRHPEFMQSWQAGPEGSLRLPGGESLEEVQQRAWGFLARLRDRGDVENVVCVTHHFVILAVAAFALHLPLERIARLRQSVGSVSTIDFRGERVQIVKWNDRCHLMDLCS